ncbi:hypothetical protein K469DRAFT_785093 [Zopfia rhizophila CBS 207.26]|uniref:Uncharacterized protein n=1 Tax=Zopfia rhizophila CBS 207.26 TaxID=1314779 RepID=A0A6A6DZ52_9PEZI|nr:hypothetical protein K469DRAFT_785093 [Zopfia rhizophila CBS 207.26]
MPSKISNAFSKTKTLFTKSNSDTIQVQELSTTQTKPTQTPRCSQGYTALPSITSLEDDNENENGALDVGQNQQVEEQLQERKDLRIVNQVSPGPSLNDDEDEEDDNDDGILSTSASPLLEQPHGQYLPPLPQEIDQPLFADFDDAYDAAEIVFD